jgi:hypothetical protein
MKRKVEVYAPGTTHSIRYNPADPKDIYLDVGFNSGFFVLPVMFGWMGLVVFLTGCGLLVRWRKARQLVCPSCGQGGEVGQKFCPSCKAPLS